MNYMQLKSVITQMKTYIYIKKMISTINIGILETNVGIKDKGVVCLITCHYYGILKQNMVVI